MVRLFVAVDTKDYNLKKYVIQIQELIRSWGLKATYPDPDQLHITLKFIGEVDESLVPKIISSLSQIRSKPITLKFDGVGGFPSLNRPRVIYVNVEDNPEIQYLQANVERSLAFLNRRDNKAFHPHVTVARIKTPYRWTPRYSSELEKLELSLELKIDYFVLKKSTLTSSGPIYTDVKVFKLIENS